jgi:adenosylmethionine-8-amino-7-oxononanoate aminotransferase
MAPTAILQNMPRVPYHHSSQPSKLPALLQEIRSTRHMIVAQRGIYQWLNNGKKFIDASGGPSVNSVGYGRWDIMDSLRERGQNIAYVYDGAFRTQVGDDLEQKLMNSTGELMIPIHICTSGKF